MSFSITAWSISWWIVFFLKPRLIIKFRCCQLVLLLLSSSLCFHLILVSLDDSCLYLDMGHFFIILFRALQMRKPMHNETKLHSCIEPSTRIQVPDIKAKLLLPQSHSTFLGGQSFVYKKGRLVPEIENDFIMVSQWDTTKLSNNWSVFLLLAGASSLTCVIYWTYRLKSITWIY